MLSFIDQPRTIRVIRLEQPNGGGEQRTHIGSIKKTKLEIPDDLRAACTADELTEIERALAIYDKARRNQALSDVYRFPQIMRQVVEHVTSHDASDFERRLVFHSLTEALRALRS